MPAKAGIQNYLKTLDSSLRGNDAKGRLKSFYETINLQFSRSKTMDYDVCTNCIAFETMAEA